MAETKKIYVRPKEAAAICSISLSKIYLLMNDGSLNFIKVGRCRLIKVEDLEKM